MLRLAVLGRAGRRRGVPTGSPGPVLTGRELQLGSHGSCNLWMVGNHGLGKVLGAWVETWG